MYLQISYDYFICENEFNEKKFPCLYFENKKLNFTDKMNYKDIWTEYNGKNIYLLSFLKMILII